jgi:hypothetical protein
MPIELRNVRATKGSQFHLQNTVNDHPERLNRLILSGSPSLKDFAAGDPVWKSPLESQGYREHQDREFLRAVGLERLIPELSMFWPLGGPNWDALATVRGHSGEQGIILLEAKSHIPELRSSGCQACPESRVKITNSLRQIKRMIGVPEAADWTGKFYQYANRLAHLHFLRVQCGVHAWMVFLYFLGDHEQNGPVTVTEWENALRGVTQELQLPETHPLENYIVTVFAGVGEL